MAGVFPPLPQDVRLIAVDMDGTLLDGNGRIPDGLWPLLERLDARGIAFAPASGRQFATLRRAFGAAGERMDFIAENGTYVVRGDREVSSSVLDPAMIVDLVGRLRALAAATHDIGVVLCGKRSAYIERTDAPFRAEADKYYAQLADVDDLLSVEDAIVKIAIFDFADAETSTAPALDGFTQTHQVVVSGKHWIDIMNRGVDKGTALRTLQHAHGITAAQTVAFGDYLNDLELLDAAGLSFAMANAHPDVLARARYRAPANTEYGVLTTIERLLG